VILTVRSERATEQKFQGAKWPGNERARERVGQGANRPESYWLIRSGERIGPGAKRLGTGNWLPFILAAVDQLINENTVQCFLWWYTLVWRTGTFFMLQAIFVRIIVRHALSVLALDTPTCTFLFPEKALPFPVIKFH